MRFAVILFFALFCLLDHGLQKSDAVSLLKSKSLMRAYG